MDTSWTAPGPGSWELDATHYPASVSRIIRDVIAEAPAMGMQEGFDLLGAPLATMGVAFVNGRMYRRLVPLVGGSSSVTPPPFVLWLATRLHPTFRHRAATAERALRERVWLDEFRRWESSWKPDLLATNRRLGSVDETALTDPQLADHLISLDGHLRASTALHFRLHTSDLGPIGLLLVSARAWGLDDGPLMDALAGSSPSTSGPARALGEIRRELRHCDLDPATLDDVRAASPLAARLLDEYMDEFGSRLTTGYDISDRTLAELPEVIVASIRDARADEDADVDASARSRGDASLGQLRSAVPIEAREEFDTLVDDARLLYGLRDENGPITYEWPAGILRRAVLEAARRLAADGSIASTQHVFDLSTAELVALLSGAVSPTADDVAARCAERMHWCDLDPPLYLGAAPVDPPIDVLPGAMAVMMRVTLTVMALLEAQGHADHLVGTGIGTEPYTGIARVVLDADDALERVEPGDVIVARFTVPTFNSVLAVAGAVVTENGGLLCHTAVIARELGIPAVVGVADALTVIPDGSLVTVDPVAGTVSVVGDVTSVPVPILD
jgi:phosphohistidine swiveling domain-containing protein